MHTFESRCASFRAKSLLALAICTLKRDYSVTEKRNQAHLLRSVSRRKNSRASRPVFFSPSLTCPLPRSLAGLFCSALTRATQTLPIFCAVHVAYIHAQDFQALLFLIACQRITVVFIRFVKSFFRYSRDIFSLRSPRPPVKKRNNSR